MKSKLLLLTLIVTLSSCDKLCDTYYDDGYNNGYNDGTKEGVEIGVTREQERIISIINSPYTPEGLQAKYVDYDWYESNHQVFSEFIVAIHNNTPYHIQNVKLILEIRVPKSKMRLFYGEKYEKTVFKKECEWVINAKPNEVTKTWVSDIIGLNAGWNLSNSDNFAWSCTILDIYPHPVEVLLSEI